MGRRPDGIGEGAVGVELQSVESIQVSGSASHQAMISVDTYSKTGFVIDYHTPGGYTKRVFLGLGIGSRSRIFRSAVLGDWWQA